MAISITAPTAGATWPAGTTQQINWTGEGPGCAVNTVCMDIHLMKGGTVVLLIEDYVFNDGNKPWDIPTNLAAGNDYQIRITNRFDDTFVYSPNFNITSSCTVPVSNFEYSVTGKTVKFTDTSTDNPTSWQWNFGDDITDTIQNPNHTYSANGTYNVSLVANNSCGSGNSVTASVKIDEGKFNYAYLLIPAGLVFLYLATRSPGKK